jgi:inosine/guanosine/xanthosine phosphorylase family protein
MPGQKYNKRVEDVANYIKSKVPADFSPLLILMTGSGLGFLAESVDTVVAKIPYSEIPNFLTLGVVGHKGELVCGTVSGVPVAVFSGRKHFYEFGENYTDTQALREIVLPICVGKKLGAQTYFATNAVGSLDPDYNVGDISLIKTHIGLFFPNVLRGDLAEDAVRFLPTNDIYDKELRNLFIESANSLGQAEAVKESTYVAVTGPSYESVGDVVALCSLGAHTVGMSVVPEVLMAGSLGMRCVAASLVTNVVNKDGQNATSHTEVTDVCNSELVKQRFTDLFSGFIEKIKYNFN